MNKVTVTRIGAVLMLGGLVVLLIGLTLSPRFANAGGGGGCSDLLADRIFGCLLGNGNFTLIFGSSNETDLYGQSFALQSLLNLSAEVDADCRCVGANHRWICQDVQDAGVILMGRAQANSLDGRAVVVGSGPVGFSCVSLPD